MSSTQTPRRTHASSALAFRQHCDYACALQRFRRPRLSVDEWVAIIAAVLGGLGFWLAR